MTNSTNDGPNGLLNVSGGQYVDTTGGIRNTDPFAEALAEAETVGTQITSSVAHPKGCAG